MGRHSRRMPALAIAVLFLSLPGWSTSRAETLQIGQAAPDFSLPGVDGKTYCLKDFDAAEILVVVFTCNHCPTAQAYEDRIKQLAADYKDRGVVLVAISPNDPAALRLDEMGYTDVGDSLDDMKVRAKDHEFNFPYLYDGDEQKVARAYGPVATPHVFIFDKGRKLRFVGRIDDSAKPENVKSHDTRNAIEALLAGRPVPVEKTKTFGCSIKWSDKRGSVKESLKRWDAEDATLEPIDKEGVKSLLANDSKKLRLVNVWATSCGPCLVEFPELVTMHRMYRRRDFELVTVSADEPDRKEQALSLLKKEHASCTNYLWAPGDAYDLVETVDPKWEGPLPYTLLIAPGGKVLYRKQGEIDPLELRKAIVEHLGRVY
jgi:peroxiredoxin